MTAKLNAVRSELLEADEKRLQLLLFLVDWKHCLEHGAQLTSAEWTISAYGPYTRLPSTRDASNLSPREQAVVQHVINQTQDLTYGELFRLVNSTYPVVSGPRYEVLKLPELSRLYRSA